MRALTVMEHERALRYRNGRFERVLEPGRHRSWPFMHLTHVKVDVRERLTVVPTQELLTQDGVSVKVSTIARWKVVDPQAFVLNVQNPYDALYTAVQLVLRSAIAGRTAEALLADRAAMGGELFAKAQQAATGFGAELMDVAIRDVVLPGDLKRVFAQVAVAKQEGLAALERARGETAALRSLANGARVLEQHPVLTGLRMVQVAAESGAKLVLELPKA